MKKKANRKNEREIKKKIYINSNEFNFFLTFISNINFFIKQLLFFLFLTFKTRSTLSFIEIFVQFFKKRNTQILTNDLFFIFIQIISLFKKLDSKVL